MSRPLLASRPLALSLAPLPHADGSAIFASGPLSVLAALAGPSEVRIRDELSDAATLVVLHTPLVAPAALPSTALGAALHTALAAVVRRELLPRTLLQLSVHALSLPPPPPLSASRPPGQAPPLPPSHPDARIQAPEVAACINAAMLALLDAGTECTATLAAASVAVLPAAKARSLRAAKQWRAGEEDQAEDEEMEDEDSHALLLDPTPHELLYAHSTHVFGFAFSGRDASAAADDSTGQTAALVFTRSEGPIEWAEYKDVLALARKAASDVQREMRAAVQRHILGEAGEGSK